MDYDPSIYPETIPETCEWTGKYDVAYARQTEELAQQNKQSIVIYPVVTRTKELDMNNYYVYSYKVPSGIEAILGVHVKGLPNLANLEMPFGTSSAVVLDFNGIIGWRHRLNLKEDFAFTFQEPIPGELIYYTQIGVQIWSPIELTKIQMPSVSIRTRHTRKGLEDHKITIENKPASLVITFLDPMTYLKIKQLMCWPCSLYGPPTTMVKTCSDSGTTKNLIEIPESRSIVIDSMDNDLSPEELLAKYKA